jgi:hypothetical protein
VLVDTAITLVLTCAHRVRHRDGAGCGGSMRSDAAAMANAIALSTFDWEFNQLLRMVPRVSLDRADYPQHELPPCGAVALSAQSVPN